MGKIAIVADSSCCLPPQFIQQYQIAIVPLTLVINGEAMEDGSLPASDFYHRLSQSPSSVSSASPPPGAFLETFKRLADQAEAILCLVLSSRYSGTYAAAANARDLFLQEKPAYPLAVMDTHNLAMAHGFSVLAAARAAAEGGTLEECLSKAEQVASRVRLIGMLDSLSYLARSGRVPRIAHWATSVLQIKPILAAVQEEIKAIERVRTRPRALERLLELLEKEWKHGERLHVAVMHANDEASARDLAERVQQRFQPVELLVTEFTPVMAMHSGPYLLGLTFYSEPPPARSAEGELERDSAEIEAALGELPPPASGRPALVALSGLPGSGKSYLAASIHERVPLAYLNSDTLRRRLFGQPSYSQEESLRLFRACHAVLDRLLARGVSALMDATNLRESHRQQLYEIAQRHKAEFILVKVTAPEALMRQRLQKRSTEEAGFDVYQRMLAEVEPIALPHIVVDTSGDITPQVESIVDRLQQLSPKGA
ncbi:MAG TPA: DegV family protein [Dehalococcoidia bacterium]|nr:DegV family protein [Dehalococcoidia bacterium]